MSKYNNNVDDMQRWTNWKLCQTIRRALDITRSTVGDQCGAIDAMDVLEKRVVRRRPEDHPRYSESGAPIRPGSPRP